MSVFGEQWHRRSTHRLTQVRRSAGPIASKGTSSRIEPNAERILVAVLTELQINEARIGDRGHGTINTTKDPGRRSASSNS